MSEYVCVFVVALLQWHEQRSSAGSYTLWWRNVLHRMASWTQIFCAKSGKRLRLDSGRINTWCYRKKMMLWQCSTSSWRWRPSPYLTMKVNAINKATLISMRCIKKRLLGVDIDQSPCGDYLQRMIHKWISKSFIQVFPTHPEHSKQGHFLLEHGHETVAKLPPDTEKVDVDSKDSVIQTLCSGRWRMTSKRSWDCFLLLDIKRVGVVFSGCGDSETGLSLSMKCGYYILQRNSL